MDYKSLPKIELHLHLDCSLSYKVVQQLDPSVSYEDYCHSFVAATRCTDLVDYLTRAVKGFELMQTKEQLRLVPLDPSHHDGLVAVEGRAPWNSSGQYRADHRR